MSVPAQVPISGPYIANGTTTQFTYNFYLLYATDMQVFAGGVKKVLNTDYTVNGVGNSQGGNVVFVTAPANGLEVLIKRATPYTRQTDYADNGDLLADVVNDDFDRIWLALQEINASFSSSISKPVGGNWDAQSLRITNLADATQPQDAVTYNQLFTVNDSAGKSAQAAAASATAAKTSETNSAASQQAAASSASAASTAAGNASDSSNLAQKWAANPVGTEVTAGKYSALHYASKAIDSATAAATSATSSAASASAASDSASAASLSATNAKSDADRAQTANPDNQLKKANNLSDVADKATARTNLGLGNAATQTVQASVTDSTANRLLKAGAFGLGIPYNTGALSYQDLINISPGLYNINGANFNNPSGNFGGIISFGDSSNGAQIFVQNNGGNFLFRGQSNKTVYSVRSTQNTTVDGSGYVKQASPIARLSNDPSVMAANFYDGFTEGGNAAVNEEAEGVSAKRTGLGSYTVSGCDGLAKEGWQIEVPKDINGNRLCFVKSEVAEDGSISIEVFKPKLDIESGGIIAGVPIDIPVGRWVDLRLSMPLNSLYNQRIQQEGS